MRVAFVDLMFSWPPHGGADVDVFHVATGLRERGHEVMLFGARSGRTWERGDFDPDSLPFPARHLEFPQGLRGWKAVVDAFRETVTEWRPDVVHVGDSFFLKPYLLECFRDLPLLARLYANELICQKDMLRYRAGAPCAQDFLNTPDVCRACGLEHQRGAIASGAGLAWTEEYLAAEAYQPSYWQRTKASLGLANALIVYNEEMAGLLRPFAREVRVVPGGVDIRRFSVVSQPPPPRSRKVILMAGRGEDPVKGVGTLIEAGRRLAETRNDFEIHITAPGEGEAEAWLKWLPWCNQEALARRYHDAAFCVVPSVWNEPFGMVALEAMACGKPVVVSDVGGLRDTIEPGVSGMRVPPGDAAALAAAIASLLEDEALAQRMAAAARQRVEEHFDWRVVVERHYVPLLESLGD
jgi:glycosyltransferase involved in cell wall biosynthesis